MKYLSLLIVLLSCNFLIAQSDLSAELISNIEKRIEYNLNQSIAIGVLDADGAHYYSFGTKSIDGAKVDEHTIYEIGSISKTFTAIMLAKMVVDRKMKLDDPAQKYLPVHVTMPKFEEGEITLGHLSDHTSSIPRMPNNFQPADPNNPYADYDADLLYEYLNEVRLERTIGSEYEYSNVAQGLLGHLLELKTGKSYDDLLKEMITGPLEMSETSMAMDENMQRNLALPYDQGAKAYNWELGVLGGAGGIRSSVADMLKYMEANLNKKDKTLGEAIQLSHTKRHDKGRDGVALAWHILKDKTNDKEYIIHTGATGGYRAFAAMDETDNRAVVVLTNSTISADDIGFHLLNPARELEIPKMDIAMVLRETIEKEGVEKGIEIFNNIKAKNDTRYSFNEDKINALGYYFMEKDLEAALAIFKLNIEEYPDSANPYDSYAEALMNKSIANYKKSIELNPNNPNAFEKLEKMGVMMNMEPMNIADNTLEEYIGSYNLAPSFDLVITTEPGHLFAQATGQPKFELFPSEEDKFYLKVVDAQVKFERNTDGQVESLTLFQNGQIMPGKRKE